MNGAWSEQRLPLCGGLVATRKRYHADAQVASHAHEGGTLSIPFRGRFLERFRGEQITVDPRRVLYKRPDFEHDNTIGGDGFDGVLVEFGPERQRWIVEAIGPVAQNVCLDDDRTRALIRSFVAAWRGDDPARLLCIESLILQLLAGLPRAARQRRHHARPAWLARVIDALHAGLPERPSLAQLAAVAGVHPVHLAQTFARHEGCSVGEFVARLRVAEVQRRLRVGGDSLAEIATACGFSDQSHMTRVFRRHTGTTPARFRGTAG